ncbi:MAG: hypothetical protein JO110_18145 [Acetobacteraceae bacterium]|nr:hypothetical protein [Acetobacteraceae bacterium]
MTDAHHHLWDLCRHHYPWLSGRTDPHLFLGDYSKLRRDYPPEDYLHDSALHNVLATVHCEAEMDRACQVEETLWLTEVNARYGFPNAIVAHAWFHTEDAEEILTNQRAFHSCEEFARSRSPRRRRTSLSAISGALCRIRPGCAASRCLRDSGSHGICACRSGAC